MAEKDKGPTLQQKLDEITKKHGIGAVVTGNELIDIKRVSTGSLGLDIITGGGWGVGKIVEAYGPESSAKAQPLSCKILTPYGWRTMGEMVPGMVVSTPDGGTSTVVGVFPQGVKDIYEITFDDRAKTKCTLDHLWLTYGRGSKLGDVLTTEELLERGLVKKNGCRTFKIPTTLPLKFEQKGTVTINPYLLGLLLGDGGLTGGGVKISTPDQEIVQAINDILTQEYNDMCLASPTSKYDYRFKKIKNGNSKCELELQMEELELMGKLSVAKHIPEEYLFTSIENRIALLQGLMDADGTVNSGTMAYSTSSTKLSEDFVFLVRSLGLRCNTSAHGTKYRDSTGKKVDGKTSYRSSLLLNSLEFTPFRLTRQINKFISVRSLYSERYIESITKVGQEECQCIAIGHPDKLYITDDFIVTHNTTLAIHGMVEAQKAFPNKKIAVIDAEHALDRKYCKKLGLDMSKVIISQPDNGEQGIDIAISLMESGEISFILIDSVAALIPKAELEGEMGDSSMGSQARLMSKALRMITGLANKTGTIVYFTNQLRSKIGIVYGSPEVTAGGNALKFYASIRIDMRKAAGDKVGDEVQNIRVTCKTVKNKLAPPFRKCAFSVEFGKGIDKASEILEIGEITGLLKRGGSWYSYKDTKIGNGIAATKTVLRDNPELMEEIESIIRANIQTYDDQDIIIEETTAG